jgi:azurin
MKNLKTIIFSALLTSFLFGCSNKSDKTTDADQTPPVTAPSNADLMKEEPTYDATRIDPNAKVVDIKLDAQGNTMTEMKFDNTEIKVPAGCTVKIKFTNKGTDPAMIHNFVLVEEGSIEEVAKGGIAAGPDKNYAPSTSQVLYASKLLQPQEETELIFPAPAKGVYDFVCTYPGHYKMMNGKFIVE